MKKVWCLVLVLLLFLLVFALSSFSFVKAQTSELTPSKDAAITNGGSTDENFGADYRLDFGFDNYSNIVYRFLVQFDLPQAISGASITSATLKLWGPTPWSSGYPSGETLRACRVTHDWVEGTGKFGAMTQDGVTWNEYNYSDGLASVANNWATPGGDYTLEDSSTVTIPSYPVTWSSLNISVTNIVKGWASGAHPNFGFIVKLENEGGGYKGGVFDSREYGKQYGDATVPKLEINYTAPTQTSPAPTSTSSPTATSTPTPTPTSTPTSAPTPTQKPQTALPIPAEYYAIAAVAIIVLAGIAVIWLRKRRRNFPPPPPPA